MRTKELKVNGKPHTGVLVCGGPGFKIYAITDNWVLVLKKQQLVINENDPMAKLVKDYIGIRYQNTEMRKTIFDNFVNFVQNVKVSKKDAE